MDNTVEVVSENSCTGCGSCSNKCPTGSITMEYDSEGFIYPVINEETCTNCGLCQKSCPELNIEKIKYYYNDVCYAVMADTNIRMQSSSGGMFTLLAENIIKKNGIVCGAVYSKDYRKVYHTVVDKTEDLAPLRGSKYVQSEIRNVYKDIEKALIENKPVLFVGCPCQVEGLYRFLDKEYELLVTADLICHGANSLYAYQSFINEIANGKEIQEVNFRDKKKYGWSTPTTIYFKDGSVYNSPWNESKWYAGFLKGIINRKCCASCHYAQEKRIGDLTLGDFWQIHKYNTDYNDWKGTSVVIVNSPKGRKIFEECEKNMSLCETVPLDFAKQYNGQLNKPMKQHAGRKFFFHHLKKDGYHKSLWYGQKWRFDVGLVGWWFAANYGSVLTYFALGKILDDMDKLAVMISIPNKKSTDWEPVTKQNIDFMKKHFVVSKKRKLEEMSQCNQFCDSFMLGSDQLWVQWYISLVGYTFFLDFVDPKKKKIAYATSFGHANFPGTEKEKDTACAYLQGFDAISVREQSGIEVCSNTFGVESVRMLDPVFLCDIKHYDAISACSIYNDLEDYLLCYILDPSKDIERAIEHLEKKLGLKALVVFDMKTAKKSIKNWSMDNVLEDVTIEDFVCLIKNSSFMFTDSHHGACFGLIYQKNFLCLANKKRGYTRFESLFNLLNIKKYLVDQPLDIVEKEWDYKPINYKDVNIILKTEKEKSLEWLESSLNKPKNKNKQFVSSIMLKYILQQ